MTEKSVLIVDDDAELRTILEDTLLSTRRGPFKFRTKVAADGKSAQALADEPFDLIITDLRMPNMGGMEFIRWLRGSTLRSAQTPVLILSGYISERDRHEHQNAAEAISFIDKPVSMERLTEAVLKALGWNEQETERRTA